MVGTDSHTTMINGLGVLGWGVGGIEAEAAMLGQPVTMLIPQVIGFKMNGTMPPGCTATDLVLTVTEMLRKKGVVDKFVEFFGDGLANLPLADRATIANMAPEYGSTCGIFPIDEETLRYLELSGRSPEQIALVEAYAKAQGMWRYNGARPADYTDVLELDLATVEPSLAGPKRPQDRVPLSKAKSVYQASLKAMADERKKKLPDATGCAEIKLDGQQVELRDGAVMIAAITSCTNTSNPYVLMAAGLLARNAAKLRPQGQALGQDQPRAGLARRHRLPHEGRVVRPSRIDRLQRRRLRLHDLHRQLGPAAPEISAGIKAGDIIATSVLSGNRNFEGRVHPEVKMNFLASPPLVVAYALAGTHGRGSAIRSRWATAPTASRCCSPISGLPTRRSPTRYATSLDSAMFRKSYANVFTGDANWSSIKIPAGKIYAWEEKSTYVRNPPYFDGMTMTPKPVTDVTGARCWRCSATRSPPITSLRPVTLPRPARPRSTWWRRACSPWTSIPTARAAATTKS